MSKRTLKLLAIAALGALAPLSAQAPAAEPMRPDSDCPYALAAAGEREVASGAAVRWSDGPPGRLSVFEPGSALAP